LFYGNECRREWRTLGRCRVAPGHVTGGQEFNETGITNTTNQGKTGWSEGHPGAGSPEYLIFFPPSAAANDCVSSLVQDLFEFTVRNGLYTFQRTALTHQGHERY
jgi:hypothetical protein